MYTQFPPTLQVAVAYFIAALLTFFDALWFILATRGLDHPPHLWPLALFELPALWGTYAALDLLRGEARPHR